MESEDIKVLVNLQIEKAHRFMAQADEMYSMKYWDLAANRYYYACYHAVQGLFIANGLPATKKHSGTVTQFSLLFVKSGKVETTYGSFLARMTSEDWKMLLSPDISPEIIPSKIKKAIIPFDPSCLEEMVHNNPAIKSLIDSFELEPDDNTVPF